MTNIDRVKCPKCNGTGKFKSYGDCFDCRGSGEMATIINEYRVVFQGKEYFRGMTLVFTATSSKEAEGEVLSFYKHGFGFEKVKDGESININAIGYHLRNKKTNKETHYPLWRSIVIKKANTLL